MFIEAPKSYPNLYQNFEKVYPTLYQNLEKLYRNLYQFLENLYPNMPKIKNPKNLYPNLYQNCKNWHQSLYRNGGNRYFPSLYQNHENSRTDGTSSVPKIYIVRPGEIRYALFLCGCNVLAIFSKNKPPIRISALAYPLLAWLKWVGLAPLIIIRAMVFCHQKCRHMVLFF